MKKSFPLFILLLALLAIPNSVAHAAEARDHEAKILCQPDLYLFIATDCSQSGPSAYINELAGKGIVLPEPPHPIAKPDFLLTYPEVLYGEVVTPNAPVFASLDDALSYNTANILRRVELGFSNAHLRIRG